MDAWKICGCGAIPELRQITGMWDVRCRTCGNSTPSFATEGEAIWSWNDGVAERSTSLSYLNAGDILQHGDEYYHKGMKDWLPMPPGSVGVACGTDHLYRRKLPKPEDPRRTIQACQAVAQQKNVKGVGKVNMNLVLVDMAEAIHQVAQVMTEGAKKHEPTGWKKVPNGVYEYTGALNRHLNAEGRGILRDPEWNFFHAAHTACCALIRLQLIIDAEKAKEGGQ